MRQDNMRHGRMVLVRGFPPAEQGREALKGAIRTIRSAAEPFANADGRLRRLDGGESPVRIDSSFLEVLDDLRIAHSMGGLAAQWRYWKKKKGEQADSFLEGLRTVSTIDPALRESAARLHRKLELRSPEWEFQERPTEPVPLR